MGESWDFFYFLFCFIRILDSRFLGERCQVSLCLFGFLRFISDIVFVVDSLVAMLYLLFHYHHYVTESLKFFNMFFFQKLPILEIQFIVSS